MAVSIGTITNFGLDQSVATTRTDGYTHASGSGIFLHLFWRIGVSGTTATITYDGVSCTAIPNTAAEGNNGGIAPWICCAAFYLPDPGSKTANFATTWNIAPDNSYLTVMEVTGHDTVAGFDGSSSISPSANTTTPTCTHTRTTVNSVTVYGGVRGRDSTALSWSPNDGMTEQLDIDSGVPNTLSLTLCTLQETTSGSLSRSSTCSASGRGSGFSYSLYTNFTGAGTGAANGVGSATGAATAIGDGSGAATSLLTAFGAATAQGAGTGAAQAAGSGVGAATALGVGSGATVFLCAATGIRTQEAAGSGAIVALGAAIGVVLVAGVGAGAALSQGEAFPSGSSVGTATGDATSSGTAVGALLLEGVALFSCNMSGQFVAQSTGMGQSPMHMRVRIGLRLSR